MVGEVGEKNRKKKKQKIGTEMYSLQNGNLQIHISHIKN
jgi:hypothetical protein